MRCWGHVSVDDVMGSLVGRCARIESTTGTQLEIARAKKRVKDHGSRGEPVLDAAGEVIGHTEPQVLAAKGTQDSWRAMDDAERRIGADIGVTRCLDGLCAVRFARQIRCPKAIIALHKLAPHRTQGELVVLILRAYQEWASTSTERAFAELYAATRRVAGLAIPDTCELAHAFRHGLKSAKSQRDAAANLYRDAILILYEWVRIWRRSPAS